MRFRVDGKIYDFNLLDEEHHDLLLRQWHKSFAVECLCNGENHSPNPLLYVKQVNDGLFLANYPSNSKNNILHDFKCRYNRFGYRSILGEKGIKVRENEISCRLDLDPPFEHERKISKQPASAKLPTHREIRERPEPRTKLKSLFLTMLQEYKVSEYRPGGRRNISKRLYKIAEIIVVNKMRLQDILYVASFAGRWPRIDKHFFIIGWGNRKIRAKPHPTNPKLVRLPLFSVDDPKILVAEVTILKNVYDRCDHGESNVNTGYYLLFRGPVGKMDTRTVDRQLCFVPAEEKTRIPVENEWEEQLIRLLFEQKRHFEKPLIGNVTELFLDAKPNIILHDTDPKTIIEVVDTDQNNSYLQRKQEAYTEKGFRFIAWSGERKEGIQGWNILS